MKKIFKLLLIFLLLMTCFDFCFADQPDVKNLKKYDFKTPDKNTLSTSAPTFDFVTMMVYIFIFIMISVLAYFFTKGLAKFQVDSIMKSKYMRVIDRLPLNKDSGLFIVKAPSGYFFIGVSSKGISLLEKLNSEETRLINEVEQSMNIERTNKSFPQKLEQFLKKYKDI